MRTGTRLARRTQLKVGLTLARRLPAAVVRSRSSIPAERPSTCPERGWSSPITRIVTGAPGWMWESLVSRSEEHTSELQSLMRISYAVFCLKKKNNKNTKQVTNPDKQRRILDTILTQQESHEASPA